MRVWRVLRVLVPVFVVAVLIGGAVALFAARPDIESAKDDVHAKWAALVPGLSDRYRLLTTAEEQLQSVPGSVRTVATDVDTALERWRRAQDGGTIDAQVRAANEVEAASRRLLVVVKSSPRVASNLAAKNALGAYVLDPNQPDATAFNASVAEYQRERRGPVRQVVAGFVGGGDIPGLDTSPPAPA